MEVKWTACTLPPPPRSDWGPVQSRKKLGKHKRVDFERHPWTISCLALLTFMETPQSFFFVLSPRLVLPFDERWWVLIHTVVEDETVGVEWGKVGS